MKTRTEGGRERGGEQQCSGRFETCPYTLRSAYGGAGEDNSGLGQKAKDGASTHARNDKEALRLEILIEGKNLSDSLLAHSLEAHPIYQAEGAPPCSKQSDDRVLMQGLVHPEESHHRENLVQEGTDRSHTKRKESGVTLIELLVVLAIIMVLASFFLIRASTARNTAQEDAARATAASLASAVSSFYLANGCYPRDVGPNTIPSGMAAYVGGQWPEWFDYEQWGYDIGISWRPGWSYRWTVWVTRGVWVPIC